jgi:hypothetical protein
MTRGMGLEDELNTFSKKRSFVQIRVGSEGPRSKRQPLALTVKHLIAWGGPKYPILRLLL